jgi:hypothetical protein
MNSYKIIFIDADIFLFYIKLVESEKYFGDLYFHTHNGSLTHAVIKAINELDARRKAKNWY